MAFRGNLLLAAVFGWAGAACGQITVHQVELSGTVVQAGAQSIAMKAANGQNWVLDLRQGNPKITVSGTAEPEMLTPGTCVRFTASIDKRTCKATEKIDNVTIFTQSPGVPERTLGVDLAGRRPPADASAAGDEAPPQGPPAGQAKPADDFSPTIEGETGPQGPKRRGGSKSPDKNVPNVASYEICAQVVNYRAGRLVVNVKNRFLKSKITAELTPEVKIGLDLGKEGLANVSPGEKISAVAYFAVPGNCPLVEKAEIVLTEPLAPPGSHRRRPRIAAHPAASAHKPDVTAKPAKPVIESNPNATTGSTEDKPSPPDGGSAKSPAKPESQTSPAVPAAKDDTAPPPTESKPEAKKPEQAPQTKKPEKEPPLKDEEKDVFEK